MIIESLKELQNKEILLPHKPSKIDKYANIPYNLGELPSSELGSYLSVWTRVVNWSGYNLAAVKVIVENYKTKVSRMRAFKYELFKAQNQGNKLAIKNIENMVDNDEEVCSLEDELMKHQTKLNMLGSVHEANLRNVALLSREITRRSGESPVVTGGARSDMRDPGGAYGSEF